MNDKSKQFVSVSALTLTLALGSMASGMAQAGTMPNSLHGKIAALTSLNVEHGNTASPSSPNKRAPARENEDSTGNQGPACKDACVVESPIAISKSMFDV